MINKKSGTHKRKILLLIKLALVLVLGHVIIRTVVMPQGVGETLAPNTAGGRENAVPVETAVAPDKSTPDYSAVLERDLFGSRVSALPAEESAPVDSRVISPLLTQSDLGIALIGTVAGSPAISRAIIKDTKTNVVGHYRTGDKVLTASIESIEKDRVILLDRGRTVVLSQGFPEPASEVVASVPTTVQATPRTVAVAAAAPKPMATFADKLRHTAAMLSKATVKAHSVEGEVEGLRVTDLGKIAGAEDLGLRDGDVIRSINGHQLSSKQKAFQIAMKARSQADLSVELMRGNKITKFSLPLK